MALVYRPTTQTIFPKNAIPWNDFLRQGVTFTFNGVVCNLVEIQMSSGGDVPAKNSQFFTTEKYNFDKVNVKWSIPMQEPYPIMYRIGVGGKSLNIVQGTLSSKTIYSVNHNLNTGDMVAVNVGAEQLPNMLFFYVGVIDVNNFRLYSTRELAIANNVNNAEVITNYINRTLRPWAYSDYISIMFVTKNLDLVLNSPNIIDSQQFTFKPDYNRPPVGNIVNSFYVILYDNNRQMLERSDIIYSNNIEYTVTGLINGSNYYIQFFVTDVYGFEYNTGFVPFNVSYTTLQIAIQPTAIDSCNDSSVDINIGTLIQTNGVVTNGYSYVDNYIKQNNSALFLSTNATLEFDGLKMIQQSYPIFTWMSPYEGFEGKIMMMKNSKNTDSLSIQYSNNSFQLLLNNKIVQTINLAYDTLTTYIIGIIGLKLFINPYYKHIVSPTPPIPVIGNVYNTSIDGFDLALQPKVPNLTVNDITLKKVQ